MDPVFELVEVVTVCRLVNGEVTEFPGEEPPGDLQPSVGNDAIGECWFWTSSDTDWVILSTFADGSAILGIYLDTLLVFDTGQIPRCTSEPEVGEPPDEAAWDAITQYVHNPPEPELNPPIGLGLTGLVTHAGVVVPGPWSDTISIPLYTINVEVRVDALTIDWGDGSVTSYPPEAYPRLIGYPDGIAQHVYEVKTCNPPGRDYDCDPDDTAYPLTISYEWGARWRANAGPWITVEVPPSTTTVAYPVTEAISVLTETG
ncbi:MAG TPA: hypothetical protein VHL52_13505 [Acidimicrobiia bacterium]|nr:hypothetical protein [Acidimicrobiia bacterium]